MPSSRGEVVHASGLRARTVRAAGEGAVCTRTSRGARTSPRGARCAAAGRGPRAARAAARPRASRARSSAGGSRSAAARTGRPTRSRRTRPARCRPARVSPRSAIARSSPIVMKLLPLTTAVGGSGEIEQREHRVVRAVALRAAFGQQRGVELEPALLERHPVAAHALVGRAQPRDADRHRDPPVPDARSGARPAAPSAARCRSRPGRAARRRTGRAARPACPAGPR